MARLPLSDPTVVLTCSRCDASGPANEVFYLRSNGALAQSWCRTCEKARTLAWEQQTRSRRMIGPPKPPAVYKRPVLITERDGELVKPCSTCHEVLPLERFTPQKQKDGSHRPSSRCKACRCAYEKMHREAGNRWRDPEARREAERRWRLANPEKSRMGVRRRRARLREAEGMFTLQEWNETLEVWGHRCAYCNMHVPGKLHSDHVVPVSRGGADLIENIVPACGPCNWSKAARTGREFMGVA